MKQGKNDERGAAPEDLNAQGCSPRTARGKVQGRTSAGERERRQGAQSKQRAKTRMTKMIRLNDETIVQMTKIVSLSLNMERMKDGSKTCS